MRRVGVLLVVMLLLVVVVVDYSRPGMVRRMVVWRRQALRWVGVMLREHQSQHRCSVYGKWCSKEATTVAIGAGNKRRVKLDNGWSAGLRDAIRLVIHDGNSCNSVHARAG
jgi:hypothetical protein